MSTYPARFQILYFHDATWGRAVMGSCCKLTSRFEEQPNGLRGLHEAQKKKETAANRPLKPGSHDVATLVRGARRADVQARPRA
jgi:hypothetical protein